MSAPAKSLIPLKESTKDVEISYTGKYTGILDQEEQVSLSMVKWATIKKLMVEYMWW